MTNPIVLIKLKNDIEKLDKIHHLKILEIIETNSIKYSENRNGIFINMNSFNAKTVSDIKNELKYIKEQEKNLNDIEKVKKELNKDYFKNNNKETANNYVYKE
tara:strand:- start:79 stop:387 length:309 start_codon:yes stop_codon:yes gene_type:complete